MRVLPLEVPRAREKKESRREKLMARMVVLIAQMLPLDRVIPLQWKLASRLFQDVSTI